MLPDIIFKKGIFYLLEVVYVMMFEVTPRILNSFIKFGVCPIKLSTLFLQLTSCCNLAPMGGRGFNFFLLQVWCSVLPLKGLILNYIHDFSSVWC